MQFHDPRHDDAINVRELIDTLRRTKWVILGIAVALGLVVGVGTWWLPRTYKAETVISPVTTTPGTGQGGGLLSLASQFGGIASLAGLSVSGESKRWESVAVLESEALTEKYISDNDLLPTLFASKWDASTQKWLITDPEKIPTPWKASQYFKSHIVKVTNDTRTGLFTLTVYWKDPKLAAKWANGLVKLANENLRARAIAEADRNIAYLTEQAAKTDAVGVKQGIYAILQTEINKAMLARGSEEYAFRVLDPAIVPERPSSLPPWLWGFIVFALSAAGLVLFIVTRMAWNRKTEDVPVRSPPYEVQRSPERAETVARSS